ncbi:monocarboxylate transporter 5-like [Haemaphysalis longicornis]
MDRGWSVATAGSLAAFFTVAMITTSGFFYVSFLEEFQVDRESASWPTSVLSIVSHSSGFLVVMGQQHFSVFQIGLAGSIFLWAGILGAVFAPSMAWMTATLGAVHGVGVGIVCVTLTIVVMMYFDKYRGIASGIKFSGYTICSLVYPKVLTMLKDAFGFRGALLVYAGLTMNVTALTLLLKEPPWLKVKTKTKHEVGSAKTDVARSAAASILSNCDTVCTKGSALNLPHTPNILERDRVLKLSQGDSHTTNDDTTSKKEAPQNIPACSKSAEKANAIGQVLDATCLGYNQPEYLIHRYHRTSSLESAVMHERALADTKPNKVPEADWNHTPHNGTTSISVHKKCGSLEQQVRSSTLQIIRRLLRNRRLFVIILGVVALDYTIAVFPATIVDYALDKRSPRSSADLSVTYCAPAELVGRIVLPMIGDCGCIRRPTLAAASFVLVAIGMLILPVTTSFASYIVVCAFITMMIGCLMSMKPVIIADYFGVESIGACCGLAGVSLLPLLLCNPAITGFFRDKQGSYDGLYQLQAGIHIFVGILFAIVSIIDRRQTKQWVVT